MREWDAVTYDRVATPHERWGRAVINRLDLAGDEMVLDAGCGSGRVTEALVERLPRGRLIAVDQSAQMLHQAQQRLPRNGRACLVNADLMEIAGVLSPLEGHLDAAISTATFHWIRDHGSLYRQLGRLLRPGGQLVAQYGGQGNIDSVIAAARELGVAKLATWYFATVEATEHYLAAADFREVSVWLEPDPVVIDDTEERIVFLQTVCLREWTLQMTRTAAHAFSSAVASKMASPVIDYVRLNVIARR